MLLKKIFRAVKRKSQKDPFYGFLVELLGKKPNDLALYRLAFRHKSVSLYKEHQKINNERLEYLGDAVLDAIVAAMLFQRFPEQKEGFLTKLRSKVVSRKCLNRLGKKMELKRFLLFSGELADNVLGNCVEALIGAMYLDFGFESTKRIVEKEFLDKYVDYERLLEVDENYKSRLVEWVQANKKEFVFKITEEQKNRRPYFYSELFIDDILAGKGQGFSKKQAEQSAAKSALENL